ncbi:MAG: undecaprenyl-diphosphate phosphatase, partial [Mangrovibacterium sp.]
HLELGHVLLGVHGHENLLFAVVVHGATVLSTVVVFRGDIAAMSRALCSFRRSEETRLVWLLLFSTLPVVLIGIFFRREVEGLFSGNLLLVGCMLLVTACLLAFTTLTRAGKERIGWLDALLIGMAQALAVLPGISRSGSTIATGLLLGKKREEMARFSFLMVILPILGANVVDLCSGRVTGTGTENLLPLLTGFLAAFFSGWLACRWMVQIVKKGKLIYFAVYCLIIGLIAIFAA